VGSAEPVTTAFKAAFPDPRDFGAYTVIAYDAAAVVYDALDRAIKAAGGQAPPRGNVISQLSVTHDFDGAIGVFGFDANGDSTRRVITVYEPQTSAPRGPWKRVGSVDYTGALPY
jgi:ABC-type branched-subunit amino acid transport system substrate-binding protein